MARFVSGRKEKTFSEKIDYTFKRLFSTKGKNLFVLLLVLAAIPLTVFVSLHKQNTQQYAAQGYLSTVTVLPIAYTNLGSAASQDNTKFTRLITDLNRKLLIDLTKGSRHYDFQEHSISYKSNNIVFHPENLPLTGTEKRIDFAQILNKENICNQVDKKGIRQIWLYTVAQPGSSLPGPITVIGNYSQYLLSGTKYIGSNPAEISNIADGIPTCNYTYSILTYTYTGKYGELLQVQGGYLEQIFKYIDTFGTGGKLWARFSSPTGKTDGTYNGCGTSQIPPNTTTAGDYNNDTVVRSYCSNWLRNNTLKDPEDISCHTWHTGSNFCDSESEGANYIVWWMQHIPAFYNYATFEGKRLRDWWDFIADFDNAITKGLSLRLEVIVPMGEITAANQPSRILNVYPDTPVNFSLHVADKYDYLQESMVLIEKDDASNPKSWGCKSEVMFEKWCVIDKRSIQDQVKFHDQTLTIPPWNTPKNLGKYYVSMYIQDLKQDFNLPDSQPCIGDPLAEKAKIDWPRCDMVAKSLDFYTLNIVSTDQKLTGKVEHTDVANQREMYINLNDSLNFTASLSNLNGTTTKATLLLEKSSLANANTWGCPTNQIVEEKYCKLNERIGKSDEINQTFVNQGNFTFIDQGTYYAFVVGIETNGNKMCKGDPLLTTYDNKNVLRCDYSGNNNDYFVIHTQGQ